MNNSRDCPNLQTSVSFPKHFLSSFANDRSISGKYIETDIDGTDDTIPISLDKKIQEVEYMTSETETNRSETLGNSRKRNFIDLSGEDTLEDEHDGEHVNGNMPKTRRLNECIDNFTSGDSAFPIFPIDNCLKSVQTPYCIVFPSISLSTCSESVTSTKDGERQMSFSNIQNLSPVECINELRPTIHITDNTASATRFSNDVLDIGSKYEYIDIDNIRDDNENSSGSGQPTVCDFVPARSEACSQIENVSAEDTTALNTSLISSQDTTKQVIQIKALGTTSSIPAAHTDTLVTVTSENITEQTEAPSTLSGRIITPQVIYATHPRTGQLVFAENLSLQPKYSLLTSSQNNLSFTPSMVVKPQPASLNSSGEDTSPEPNNETRPTAHRSTQEKVVIPNCLISSPKRRVNSAEMCFDEIHGRESHNIKERKRRARIKEACDLMRFLVPGMTDKTDKATVFEFGARYIHFLKSYVGTSNDKDFLIKYSPYY